MRLFDYTVDGEGYHLFHFSDRSARVIGVSTSVSHIRLPSGQTSMPRPASGTNTSGIYATRYVSNPPELWSVRNMPTQESHGGVLWISKNPSVRASAAPSASCPSG